MNFDYVALHVRCLLLLQALYEEFRTEVSEKGGDDEELEMGSGILSQVVYWVFEILQDRDTRKHTLERVERVMRPVVELEGDHEVERVRDFVAGRIEGEDGRALLGGS